MRLQNMAAEWQEMKTSGIQSRKGLRKSIFTSSNADSSSLTCWSFVCSSLCFLFRTCRSKDQKIKTATKEQDAVPQSWFLSPSPSSSVCLSLSPHPLNLGVSNSCSKANIHPIRITLYFSSSCENFSLAWPISFWRRACKEVPWYQPISFQNLQH